MDKLGNLLGLTRLQAEAPLILSTFVFLTALFNFNKYTLKFIFPNNFDKLSESEKREWQSYSVSLIASVFLIFASIPIISDTEFRLDPFNHWTLYTSKVNGIANGYFIWDILFCLTDNHGKLFVLHGLIGFLATLLGFKPTMHYFGAAAFMYELSTPFLNINWFLMKAGLKGSKAHVINGVLLLVSYFLARIVYGIYFTITTVGLILYNEHELNYFMSSALITMIFISTWLNVFWFCKLLGKAIHLLK